MCRASKLQQVMTLNLFVKLFFRFFQLYTTWRVAKNRYLRLRTFYLFSYTTENDCRQITEIIFGTQTIEYDFLFIIIFSNKDNKYDIKVYRICARKTYNVKGLFGKWILNIIFNNEVRIVCFWILYLAVNNVYRRP